MTVHVGEEWVTSDETYTLLAGQYKLLLIETMVDGVWVGNAVNGYGNSLDNVLDGNIAANVLNGYGGNDTIDGSGGCDTVYGGAGNDYLYVGDDMVPPELTADLLFGGTG